MIQKYEVDDIWPAFCQMMIVGINNISQLNYQIIQYTRCMLQLKARHTLMLVAMAYLLVICVHGIRPTRPIIANPNTQSSPANFMFYFMLQNPLPSTGYLLITFSTYTTSAIPTSCVVLNSTSLSIPTCVNLNTGGNAISITQLGINIVNPNINGAKTVVMQFNQNLLANTEYKIQIVTNNVLPNIGSITTSFQMYMVTNTGVFIEENWNFGQAFLEQKQDKGLAVLSRNSMVSNQPGESFTGLLFQITIGVATPTPNARFKFVIDGGFKFTDSSLVNTQALVGSAPAILSTEIVSPNVIITTFNQSFAVGRRFSLTIADYKSPLSISSGYISVYHLPFNSMSPLQISQQNIPLQTVPFVPTLNILTIDGTVPSKPIQFYTSTTQYIKLTIMIPRDVQSNFVIQIQADTLIIHEGSVHAKTSTVESTLINYNYYSSYGVRISGFPLIPDSSLITVTMRVEIPSNPIFRLTVKVDQLANLGNPIIQGSITSNSAVIPQTYVSLLTGTQGQANKISWMQTSDSMISFTVTPTFQTNAGSALKIITSQNMVKTSLFSTSTSCVIAGTPQYCTVTTNDTFTTILIPSNSSYNLFPQAAATTVVIKNLTFNYASSHTENIYHFYFSLIVSQAVNATERSLLMVPMVIPQREQITTFTSYFSNDLRNTGTNFPNIVRLVSTSTAPWQNIIQAYERRIITIFSYNGWKSLFTLNNGDAYPGASNVAGFTYTYKQGTSSSLDPQYPLDWDRIEIVLDGNQASTAFSIILPTLFTSSTAEQYEIMIGVYNVNTRRINYLNIQPMPVSGNPTYILSSSTALSSKPKVTTNKIQLAGKAGSYKDNVNITITPGTPTFSATRYSSALIVVSDWQWFDSSSSFSSLSTTPPGNPLFRNIEQTPKSIYMPVNQKYLTYIPLFTSGVFNTQFILYMNGVKFPYTADLPYYSIYLVDQTGTIDCYNEFINQDKAVFYSAYLQSLTFSCNVNSLQVENTYCTVTFIPNNQIQVGSVLRVYFTGMQISTNMCSFTQSPSTLIPSTCQSDTDKNLLTLTLGNTQRLAAGLTYTTIMYGISILTNTIIYYVSVQLRDPSSSYVIESGTRVLYTSVASFRPVYINQVKYSKNNPIVYSSFSIKFTLPRQLNADEEFAIVMSKDLSNLNTISSKLNVVLYDATDKVVPIIWKLNLKNYQILFQGLTNVLTASDYTIEIHGIKTPSTIEQDLISIIYVRKYDSSYTVYNNAQSTTVFPTLADKINSLITMTPYFNTEGLEQQLTFNIQNQFSPVNQDTVWIINFPRYYSEHLWNEAYLSYCTIDNIFIQCARDANTPYQITITNSPRQIEIGQAYTLKIFGLPCPRAAYLNGNAQYITQSIFLGISQNSTSPSFVQYSQLFLTQTIVNPQNLPYGSITIVGVSSSNMEVLQSTFFTINATCTQPIAANQGIYITFPEQFDNFNDLPLTVEVVQGANDQTYISEVVNRRIGFNMSSMSLLANTLFTIKVSSLPSPTNPVTIDMNKLRIIASTSDNSSTTASTLQLHNLLQSMTFLPSSLHIVINNYQTIQVTAGTYSLPIKIEPSDFTTYVSNIKITFVSDALAFRESPTYIYLESKYGTFSVGADQTIIPTVYSFDIIKTQASISAAYTSLTKYTVLVKNVPISITMPATFSVPLGGCSVPYQVVLSNSPFSDLNINFEYDTQLYNLHLFWVNEQTSYNQLEFDRTITRRWLSFCADAAIGVSNVAIRVFLGGTNYQAYSLTNTLVTVNIIANTTTNVAPTFTIATKNLQKTYAGLQITTNINGQIFYELKIAPMGTPMSFISLKTSIKEYDLLLESSADYLTHIYQSDRYHRVGLRSISSGVNKLQFDDLMPGQKYTLCVYFENQHRAFANQKCITFSTIAWGIITKAIITFNSTIYESQLNKALCFFVKASQSKINQVVDIQGRSCSLGSAAQNYYYSYPGTTISSQLKQTLVYFITNTNLTTDPSVTKFSNIYNSSGITAASLSLALSSFAVNYIQSSYLRGTFDPAAITGGSGSFTPQFKSDEPVYTPETGTISIPNCVLSKAGSLYLVLSFNRRIIYNKITGHTDIQIRPAIVPTSQQLLNCKDGYGQAPLSCRRVIFLGGQAQTIVFTNVSSNSLFMIYYGVANQYPLRPIFVSSVSNFSVLTTYQASFGHWVAILAISVILMLLQ